VCQHRTRCNAPSWCQKGSNNQKAKARPCPRDMQPLGAGSYSTTHSRGARSPLLEMKTHHKDFFFKFDLTSLGEERKAVHNSPVYKSSCFISIVNACGIYYVSKFLHFFQGKSNRRICIMLSMQNCISRLSQVFPWESSLP